MVAIIPGSPRRGSGSFQKVADAFLVPFRPDLFVLRRGEKLLAISLHLAPSPPILPNGSNRLTARAWCRDPAARRPGGRDLRDSWYI